MQLTASKYFIAAVSSFLVLGTLALVLVTSPGWETVKSTFFDIEYGKEVFPTVIKGLWINLQLTFMGGAAIGVIALGLALMRTTKSPALTPFRFLATAYVDIFRGAPLILIILLVGFGVPALGLKGISSNVIFLEPWPLFLRTRHTWQKLFVAEFFLFTLASALLPVHLV